MAHIPRSYHLGELKPPKGLLEVAIRGPFITPEYGVTYEIRTDTSLKHLDLIAIDSEIFQVGRQLIDHPDYCQAVLFEKKRLNFLRDMKYGGPRTNRTGYSFPKTMEGADVL